MEKVWVHCFWEGKDTPFKSYDYGFELPLDPRGFQLPPKEYFEDQARTSLTNEGLARPPYKGIRFHVEYPRI
jgi:hypothetical protein